MMKDRMPMEPSRQALGRSCFSVCLSVAALVLQLQAAPGVAHAQAQAPAQAPAAAQEDELFSKAYIACMTKAAGVTVAMRACMGTELKLQDKRLNVAYQKLMGQQQAGLKNQLLEAQRAWLKFRDLNCAYHAGMQGGTMSAAVSDDCHLSSTAARARELESAIQ